MCPVAVVDLVDLRQCRGRVVAALRHAPPLDRGDAFVLRSNGVTLPRQHESPNRLPQDTIDKVRALFATSCGWSSYMVPVLSPLQPRPRRLFNNSRQTNE